MSRPVRVVVTGAGGQVGRDLVDTLEGLVVPGADAGFWPDARPVDRDEFEVLGLSRHELDVTDRDGVVRAMSTVQPDVIVHLAAYTAVDRAERDAEACYAVNARGTETMVLAARASGAHLVTVSTDYVFDGEKGAPYVEDDPAHPLSVYGASKWAGEQHCGPEDSVVRTSWVMGVRGRNVAHVIAARAEEGATVRFVDDQVGTVTVAADLARALVTLVRARPGGVWHVANAGAASWFEVARYVGECRGRGDEFATAIRTDELDPAPLARRPRRSDLATDRWRAQGWAAPPPWREGVARLVADRSHGGGA